MAGGLSNLAQALRRRKLGQAYGTYEQTPGRGVGHLEELIDAPYSERLSFTLDPRSSWDVGGEDALYKSLGYRMQPTQSMIGAFRPKAGGLEINPGTAAAFMMPATEAAKSRALRDMTAVESARAFIDAQNAAAGHLLSPLQTTPPEELTSFALELAQSPTRDSMEGLVNLAEEYGFFPVDTGSGMSFINNPFVPQGEARTGASMEALAQELPDTRLATLAPGAAATPARIDSVFEEYEPLLKVRGAGGATRKFLDDVLGNPEVASAIEPELMRKAEANFLRDMEKQRTSGYAVREDIQLARQILASQGITGLKKALESGAVLPAVAAAILMPERDER